MVQVCLSSVFPLADNANSSKLVTSYLMPPIDAILSIHQTSKFECTRPCSSSVHDSYCILVCLKVVPHATCPARLRNGLTTSIVGKGKGKKNNRSLNWHYYNLISARPIFKICRLDLSPRTITIWLPSL